MTVGAHAKVNLRLRVFAPDAEGYHGLETIFLRLELADDVRVEVRPSADTRLELEMATGRTDEDVPAGPSNLAWKAAEALLSRAGTGTGTGVEIRLVKRIPSGSGLGGASADAAAVLQALNERLGNPLNPAELLEIGGQLGSDVPFFLLPQAMALGWERGRGLLPLPAPPPRPVLVLQPSFPIGSAEAYRWLDHRRETRREPPPAATALPAPKLLAEWETLRLLARNDFEDVAFERHPELARWKQMLTSAGAEIALMSGSGSALFSVFESEQTRDAAAERFGDEPDVRILPTTTVSDASERPGSR